MDVAISSDAAWAVVVHGGAMAGVSLVDLTALRRGSTSGVAFSAITNPGGVTVSADTAYVLSNPAVGDTCAGASSIIPFPLALPPRAGSPIVLTSQARDVAVVTSGPRAGMLIAAMTCMDALVVVSGGSGAPTPNIVSMPKPTSVAISGGRVWGIGHAGGDSQVHLVLSSSALDGTSPTELDMPVVQEEASADALSNPPDVDSVARINADMLDAWDLAVLPDAKHVALIQHAKFHSAAVTAIQDGIPPVVVEVMPPLDMETYEYNLIDVGTGVLVHRVRTSCTIMYPIDNSILLDDWSCTNAPNQDTTNETLIPTHLAALYGDK
jgi:hypothetical protein